jgi:L-ascorbate metabolism protein UlaG (beta-lactamase superfamily)
MKTMFSLGLSTLGAVSFLLLLGPLTCLADAAPTPDTIVTEDGALKILPINHATLALQWKDRTIYVDPVGGAKAFQGLPKPDLILLTDIHGDHFSKETLAELVGPNTKLVCPAAVADQMTPDLRNSATILTNGQTGELLGVKIEAIPMYNLTTERLKFHNKGRGNGYVVTLGGKRIYLSGDTEDIPEMRALKNIDVAFVCMNLPYTMTVDQAAAAVRAFKPRIVYPYHYRGSDINKFKELVGTDAGVEVRLRDWYPKVPNK